MVCTFCNKSYSHKR